MAITKYPCVYMRGGTSKAVFFHEKDLPADKSKWPELFLKVMGSPDPKQIDGMGGTVSSTSKVAVIAPSERPGIDVDYTFNQVDIKIPRVDQMANCGNISSAVGPFAIDEGLVKAEEPVTIVRVLNTNTNKVIEEHVRVQGGHAMVEGDEIVQGVPGTGSRIDMYFVDPGGACTGELFPSGQRREWLDVPGYNSIEVTIIDCANAIVFVRAADLGLNGTELLELNQMQEVMEHIECIRCVAAEKCGFVTEWEEARTKSTSVPKVAILSQPQRYFDIDGHENAAESMDVCVRAVSVGRAHHAYPITMAIATGAAVLLEGTIVHEIVAPVPEQSRVLLGHASGITEVNVEKCGERIVKGGVVRTARRIMDGWVYVKE